MTTLGVFRDDFYDPIVILPEGLFTSTSQASGTLAASALAGAQEVYVTQSGATALTLDTAVNIIGQLQALISAQIGNTSQPSLTSITNLSWILTIRNSNGGTLTLTAGTGNTITGTATLATLVARKFLVTVTSLTTLTFQDLGGSLTQ